MLAFDLAAEVDSLCSEWPWREHGHNARTLVKNEAFRTVLVVLKAGAHVREYVTYHHVSVQALAGRLLLHLPERSMEIAAGGLIALGPSVPNDIEALEDSSLLLCLGWSEE